jgi:hypothetical protein
MKVKDFIEKLKELDQEAEVVLSKDAEGNSFSPVCDFSTGTYAADTTYSGEFTSDYSEEGESPPVRAICLWPVN